MTITLILRLISPLNPLVIRFCGRVSLVSEFWFDGTSDKCSLKSKSQKTFRSTSRAWCCVSCKHIPYYTLFSSDVYRTIPTQFAGGSSIVVDVLVVVVVSK
jgi:hypothetical protein